jgi:hypothetical protein
MSAVASEGVSFGDVGERVPLLRGPARRDDGLDDAMPRNAALMPGTGRGAGPPLSWLPRARTCAAKWR